MSPQALISNISPKVCLNFCLCLLRLVKSQYYMSCTQASTSSSPLSLPARPVSRCQAALHPISRYLIPYVKRLFALTCEPLHLHFIPLSLEGKK